MKRIFSSFQRHLAVASCLLLGVSAAVGDGPDPGPGNLTITVQENENGSLTISAAGTANVSHSGWFQVTSRSWEPASPPTPLPYELTLPLPPGITFTFPDNPEDVSENEPDRPQNGENDPITLPATTVDFEEGAWGLGAFGAVLYGGDTVTGAGSVTVNTIPFSHFVPGTFVVEADEPTSEPEPRPRWRGSLFQVTYRVIPFQRQASQPQLSLDQAEPFGPVVVDEPGRSQTLKIKNVGQVRVAGIRSRLSRRSSDFDARIENPRPLNPGQSLLVRVHFRPMRPGSRRAVLHIDSSAPSVSTNLAGVGVRPAKSPRFPRGVF